MNGLIEDEPTCPVCLEEYRIGGMTRVFQCGHSVCLRCCNRILETSMLKCPVCVRHFAPSETFPTNYQLEEVLAAWRYAIGKVRKCIGCKNDFDTASMHICITCLNHVLPKNLVCYRSIKIDINALPLCSGCCHCAHESSGHLICDFEGFYESLKKELHAFKVNKVSYFAVEKLLADKLFEAKLADRVNVLNKKAEEKKRNQKFVEDFHAQLGDRL